MVHEQARLVFSIPFNLREGVDNDGSCSCFRFFSHCSCTITGLAFPHPDNAVRDYLAKTAFSPNQHILKSNYLKFLTSLFTLVMGELNNSEEAHKTTEDLAKWWSSRLAGGRKELYDAVVNGALKDVQVRIREVGMMFHR